MCLFTSLISNGTERWIILSRQSPIELLKRAQSIQCLTRELRRNVMIAIRQTTCHSKKKKTTQGQWQKDSPAAILCVALEIRNTERRMSNRFLSSPSWRSRSIDL